MKRIISVLFACLLGVTTTGAAWAACTANEIDVNRDGTNCQTAKFTVTTTSTNIFNFVLEAAGTFYVDWGDGSAVQTITRNDPTSSIYKHSYSSGRSYTIRFGGTATGYLVYTNSLSGSIRFWGYTSQQQGYTAVPDKIASVSGSLGALFPQYGTNPGQHPLFIGTFKNATNLTSIPNTLFSGLTGGGLMMFANTFAGSGLTAVPAGLFDSITTGGDNMFDGTFRDCTSLSLLPSDLFDNIANTNGVENLFFRTFLGCTGLTTLPSRLFGGVSVAGSNTLFYMTFDGCTGLTSLPADLFDGITAGAPNMFTETFYGCTGLTSLPSGLFGDIQTSSAANSEGLFAGTFDGCTGLTSLPSGLFSNSMVGGYAMFNMTFHDCTSLASIPSDLFSGITTVDGSAVSIFSNTFENCTALTSVPSDLFDGITTSVPYMFSSTFANSGLTSIPANLFGDITTADVGMFEYTFGDCTNLAGYIPPSTFAGLIANNHPTATDMWSNTFDNTALTTDCSTLGLARYTTGYESSWNSKVSCAACAPGEIYVADNGGHCETAKFTVTTTSNTSSLKFTLSAKGTFYVDCGDGGTLTSSASPTDVSGKTITRSNTTIATYTCTWGSAGVHNVRFGGVASGTNVYNTTTNTETISFYQSSSGTQNKIASISGSLGALFPVIGTGSSAVPRFYQTFREATNLTSIPSTLFSGIDTSHATNTSSMFQITFDGCTGLTEIPAGLFSAIDTSNSTNTSNMFKQTFNGCTGLTEIPAGLFSAIDTSNATNTSSMFKQTFNGCTGLEEIPSGLFSAIDTSSSTNTSDMFYSTFYGCTGLTGAIPPGLFSAIDTSSSTNTNQMFRETFATCRGLEEIPSGLFSGIDTSSATNTSHMFQSTFNGCRGLTGAIPSGLFSAIDTSNSTNTNSMFQSTFYGCTGLTGAIPPGLFSAIDTSNSTNTNQMFMGTFGGCTGLTSIPSGLFSGIDTSSSTNTSSMFINTFNGCTGLTEIPAGLFSAIDTSNATNTSNMFKQTFNSCTHIAGFIPPTAFPSTIVPGSSSSSDMWLNAFVNTALITDCSTVGLSQYYTGFESDWAGKVSCDGCNGNRIDVAGDGSQCEDSKFTLTTTSSATSLIFSMSASGTFYVDCGDDGTLTGTGVSGKTITRSNTNAAEYSCSWNSAGAHTIRFGGVATGSNASYMIPAISFYKSSGGTQDKIASISGSLSALIPVVNHYRETFRGATNLTTIPSSLFKGGTGWARDHAFENTFMDSGVTSIPADLFEDITGVGNDAFSGTFQGCSGITAIPSGLFDGVASDHGWMYNVFKRTFKDCTSLTTIPTGLFSDFFADSDSWTDVHYMFYETFAGCTSLASIPSDLFSGLTNDLGNWTDSSYLFFHTFSECSNLAAIPSGLFDDITPAPNSSDMFNRTFYGCTRITTIPSGLFDSITATANSSGMFNSTFYNCSGITAIPSGLFDSITVSTPHMFRETFRGCSSITAIPSGLFDNVSTSADYLFYGTFLGTRITSIPSGLFANFTTGAPNMFGLTFNGCSSLTAIPSDLFSNITTAADNLFDNTFSWASGLNGKYIPPTTFSGLIAHNSPVSSNMWINTFANTGMLTACPLGTKQYMTGYEGSTSGTTWNGFVSCEPCPNSAPQHGAFTGTATNGVCDWTCDHGYEAKNGSCVSIVCTGANYYDDDLGACVPCPTGYTYNTTDGKTSATQCQIQCAAGTYVGGAPSGYTSLQYIESTGTQYINTGYTPSTTNISGRIVAEATQAMSQVELLSSSNLNIGYYQDNSVSLFYLYENNLARENYKSFTTGTPFDIEFASSSTGRSLTINGDTESYNDVGGSTANFQLFGAQYLRFPGRIYSLEIYDNGNLGVNMIPVRRNSDNAVGMYDLARNQFYGNAGSGTFTAGPVANAPCVDVGTGYYSAGAVVNYGSSSTRTPCPAGTYSGITNAASCTTCSSATSSKYPNSAAGSDEVNDCYVTTAATKYVKDVGAGEVNCLSGGYCPGGVDIYVGGTHSAQHPTTGGRTTCPENNYCGASVASPTTCSSATSSKYTKSAAGSGSVYQCYLTTTSTKYVAEEGAGQVTCAAGGYCPGGYDIYYDDGNNDEPNPNDITGGMLVCAADTYSNAGASSCTACNSANGYHNNGNNVTSHAGVKSCVANCGAGTYVSTSAGACGNVGAGYYMAAHTVKQTETDTSARGQCPSGLTTIGYGLGADESGDCGRKFHAGDGILYLRSNKKTNPSLNIKVGNTTFYGNMSTTDTVMSNGATRKLKIKDNDGTVYWVHDDSAVYVCDTSMWDIIGNTMGEDYGYKNNNGTGLNWTSYTLTDNNSFVLDFGDLGMVTGHARCSSQGGTNATDVYWSSGNVTTVETLTDETGTTGQYCYCRIDGYTPDGGTLQPLSAPWVYVENVEYVSSCAYDCAELCGEYLYDSSLGYNELTRQAAFGPAEACF